MRAEYCRHDFIFKQPGGTSRGVLHQKESFFIRLIDDSGRVGIGECGIFRGLSIDDRPEYEQKIQEVCTQVKENKNAVSLLNKLINWPSIRFGLETALTSLKNSHSFKLFDSDFSKSRRGIDINGLIWMGDVDFMYEQIEEKLDAGFSCLKLKIGALDFDSELALLRVLRNKYSKEILEIRVDANGAFSANHVGSRLDSLSKFDLHSIEQPIKQGQLDEMYKLCRVSPIPIALDEELIGIHSLAEKEALLKNVKPHYIILKPSLLGGFMACNEWLDLSRKYGIDYWITSALESNIGLNAIAQFTASLDPEIPQGLGTGALFSNNFDSPLEIRKDKLWIGNQKWDISPLNWNGQ